MAGAPALGILGAKFLDRAGRSRSRHQRSRNGKVAALGTRDTI